MITPVDDFLYLVNNVLLGDEPVRRNKCTLILTHNLIVYWYYTDRRRLHFIGGHNCGICGVCIMVLLSCSTQGSPSSTQSVSGKGLSNQVQPKKG